LSTSLSNSLQDLMREALDRNASDLHLMSGAPPTLRVHGRVVAMPGPDLTAADVQRLVTPLLTPAQATRLERRYELDFAWQEADMGRFRVSIFRERGAISAALRVIPTTLPDIEELGLPPAVRELATRQNGLVLITGAVGNGKSTTMNTMIDLINSSRDGRVLTIEDPIEYLHRNKRSYVLQRELDSDTRSFHRALVAAMRQDPNVICIGEMRDRRTVATALTAAETGHLVVSTLHTYDAVHTIDRIIDVFPPHQQNNVRLQLSNVLEGVLCQKLLPHASGDGRVLAYELMLSTPATRRLIRDGKTDQLKNSMATGRTHGMLLMDHCLGTLFRQGRITLETARAHMSDVRLEPELAEMAGVAS